MLLILVCNPDDAGGSAALLTGRLLFARPKPINGALLTNRLLYVRPDTTESS